MPVVRDALQHLQDLFSGMSGLDVGLAIGSWNTALRSLAALFLIASLLLCAMRVTRWLLPQSGVPLRWSSIFGVGMWISTAGFHVLLSLQAFNLVCALLACGALLLMAIYARPEHAPLAWTLRRELRAVRAIARLVRRGGYPLWNVFAGFGALLTIRAFVIPPLGWDTITYHAPRAVQWVQSNRFTFDEGVGSYDFYRHFFSGGEVLMAWAMLPFHSDLLVNLASVVEWLGVGLASWALARGIGLKEPFASSSAAAVMFIPTVQLELSSGYVELALNTALFSGIAVALLCLRRPTPGRALLCAMSLGVAIGIKFPGAPPAAVFAMLVAIYVLATRAIAWKAKLITLCASAIIASIPAAPWMIRAWRDTGYPLSPLPVSVFGHTLGLASATMKWYGQRAVVPYLWPVEYAALMRVFSPLAVLNESLGVLAFLPLAVFFIGLFALLRRRPIAGVALLAAALAPVLAHFSKGMTPVRLTHTITTSRFLVPTLAIAITVSFAWCQRGRYASNAYRWLLLGCALVMSVIDLRRGWIEWEYRELALVGLLLTQLFWCALFVHRRNRAWGAAVSVIAWMLLCSIVSVRRDETRQNAYAKSYALHDFPRFWAAGVPFVDEPDKPHRIAITGGPNHSSDTWFYYFFMGRRFQNWIGYVTPTRDGGVAQAGPGGDLAERADVNSWLARLSAAKIDEVLTFPPRSIEQGWMEIAPTRFDKLAGRSDWGLFRLKH